MKENNIDPKLVEKARALGQAARNNGVEVRGNVASNAGPTPTPNAKQENQGDRDAKYRSLPKEQQEHRGQQQRGTNGRGGL